MSIALFAAASSIETERTRARFDRYSEQRFASLESSLRLTTRSLEALAAFYHAAPAVDRTAFRRFVRPLLASDPAIQALEWSPYVSADRRQAMERAAREHGYPGFEFNERANPVQMDPATVRGEYFPVYYVEPLAGSEPAVGYDLASNAARWRALWQAIDTGQITATERIVLVQQTGNQYGFLLFAPVYAAASHPTTAAQRRAALRGVVLGVFRVGAIVRRSIGGREDRFTTLDLYDQSAPPEQQLLFAKGGRAARPVAPISAARVIRIGDRYWRIVATPTATFADSERSDLPLIILFGTIVFTLATGMYTLSHRRQRHRATEAEALLRDALASMSEGFAFFDADDRLVVCNEAYRQGYPESRAAIVPGARFEDVLRAGLSNGQYRDAVGREEEWLAERLRAHRELDAPVEQQMPDGRWLLVSARRTSGGGTAELRVDITALKGAQAELARSREHLARAQRIAHMGSDVRELRTDAVEWSDENYRIFGVSRDDFVPTTENFLALVHPDDRAIILSRREQMQAGIGPDPVEIRIIRPDGTLRHIRREIEVIKTDAGEPIGFAGTNHDITELRAAQQRQRELEQQLLHSQKIEALGTLAGGIAHDLNNTLVPIVMLSKLALRDLPQDDPLHEDLATIVQAGEQARDLVAQILAFSRKQELVRREIDFAAVVRDTVRMLRASLLTTIELVDEIVAVPPLFGDPAQLRQVVVNLVTNAAQAIGDRTGRITLRLMPEDNAIRLEVADTGCGIDPKTLGRIFEPFFTTKGVGEGTGLGLSVVHGIVTGHGGTIAVRSAPGEGTLFTILLPLDPPAAMPANTVAA